MSLNSLGIKKKFPLYSFFFLLHSENFWNSGSCGVSAGSNASLRMVTTQVFILPSPAATQSSHFFMLLPAQLQQNKYTEGTTKHRFSEEATRERQGWNITVV